MSRTQNKSSRRGFLKTAAATLAAPMIIPCSVLGGKGRTAPNSRINIGMIGMGRQAYHVNVKSFLHADEVRVVAVCDVDSWRMENARKAVNKHYAQQQTSGDCLAYQDYRELLANSDIDAVMISTPDHWHASMAIAAATAGKDVCCEKPLCRTIAQGRQMAEAMRRYDRVFRTDSEFRSHRCFQRACELVQNGYIGKLHTIRTGVPKGDIACAPQPVMPVPPELDYPSWLGPAPTEPYTEYRVHPPHSYNRPGWMRVRDYCDGMITNWGTHLNDIAQWGNGTERSGPVEVEARGTYPSEGLWNVLLDFEAEYKYANGVRLHYHISDAHIRFEGDEGWVQADYKGRRLTAHPASILKSPTKPGDIRLLLKSEKQDFIDCMKTRERTLADAEVGHRTNSLCLLANIAIQRGCKLHWDPAKERFLDDDIANRYVSTII
jgi:myo-inositol 2-dehydrogenase / D-chiro-inositol 1-dehydrogenase